jgi:uncharacterized membrane protein
MATLTVWMFDTPRGADHAARRLQELAGQDTVILHDAATVSWQPRDSKPRTRQLADTAVTATLGGSFWGLLFGMIFFVPLVGAAVGTATGAVTGSLADVGIDDSFINKVRDQVTPGTSALFVLGPDAVHEGIRSICAPHRPTDLILTTLSPEQEDAVRSVFTD